MNEHQIDREKNWRNSEYNPKNGELENNLGMQRNKGWRKGNLIERDEINLNRHCWLRYHVKNYTDNGRG